MFYYSHAKDSSSWYLMDSLNDSPVLVDNLNTLYEEAALAGRTSVLLVAANGEKRKLSTI
jgi:hypothetical protein